VLWEDTLFFETSFLKAGKNRKQRRGTEVIVYTEGFLFQLANPGNRDSACGRLNCHTIEILLPALHI
jgi:hypothetical protein